MSSSSRPASKSFAVRYRYAGKSRKLTLQAGITLAAARKAAADALYQLEQGHDPGVARRHARQAQRLAGRTRSRPSPKSISGEKAAACAAPSGGRGCSSGSSIRRSVAGRSALIKRSEIVRLLDKITEGTPLGVEGGPFIADRALAIIRRVMNWHATRGRRLPLPDRARHGPCGRSGAHAHFGRRRAARGLGVADVATGPFASPRPIRVTNRSASQRSRRHCDGRNRRRELGRCQSAGNKTKVDLVRPLSVAAQDVLARAPRLVGCDFVFSTDGRSAINGFSHFKRRFDAQCGVTGWTLHDLRRTARHSCAALASPSTTPSVASVT